MLVFKRGSGKPLSPPQLNSKRLDEVNERAHLYLQKYLGYDHAEKIWLTGQKMSDLNERAMFYAQAVVHVESQLSGKPSAARDYVQYRWKPVGIREFICSSNYLNKREGNLSRCAGGC